MASRSENRHPGSRLLRPCAFATISTDDDRSRYSRRWRVSGALGTTNFRSSMQSVRVQEGTLILKQVQRIGRPFQCRRYLLRQGSIVAPNRVALHAYDRRSSMLRLQISCRRYSPAPSPPSEVMSRIQKHAVRYPPFPLQCNPWFHPNRRA